MRRSRILAVVLAFVGLSVAIASGLTAVGLTEELRVLSLVIVPSVVVATLRRRNHASQRQSRN